MNKEEKIEYWASIIMGEWVLNQQKLGIEQLDMKTFATLKQGVVMGLEKPVPDSQG